MNTLNGRTITTCRVSIPAWGPWMADVECASGDELSGPAVLAIDDLTLRGTILRGGPIDARTSYRIVGGAGGWGRTIAAKGEINDAGVKYATVLNAAAIACGETMGTIPAGTVGPSYVRVAGPASRVLEELFPRGWYIDEAGATHIGRRPVTPYTGTATRMVHDTAQGRIVLAPASIATLLPGAVVDGVEAVDIEHVLDGTLRTTVWGRRADRSGEPVASGLARIVETLTAHHRFFAPWEYRVVQKTGNRYDLQPVRVSAGMPELRLVRVRPGLAGGSASAKLGSLVVVAFVNGDPARPEIVAFDHADSPGYIPDEIKLQAGSTGTAATEHGTSAEALVVAVNTTINAIGAAITAGGGVAAYLGAIISALAVDVTFASGILAAMAAGTIGPTTKTALLAALAAKSADTGGDTPSLGWPNVRGG